MIDHSKLYPKFDRRLGVLLGLLRQHGLAMHGVAGYRTKAEQDALYAQGRTRAGPIVTNARGGESPHNWGCACDMVFSTEHPYVGDWSLYGGLVQQAGLTWGGAWGDYDHCELPTWKEVRAQGWTPPG